LGKTIDVVDLRATFKSNPANRGSLVLDAYLSPQAGPHTAAGLLNALERSSKRASIRTHYVAVQEIFPDPDGDEEGAPAMSRDDRTSETLRNI
jgi:hypothetical protein